MAQDLTADLVATALWPQGDIRDPLGVWGTRLPVTGDATGGGIKVASQAPAGIAGAYVYTVYSALIAILALDVNIEVKARLLTNWPDVDPLNPGVQGYGSAFTTTLAGATNFTAPNSVPERALIQPQDRYVLLFDPRPVAGAFSILELEINENTDTRLYTFEAWGYYWDRSVLNAPGGLRHPGAS